MSKKITLNELRSLVKKVIFNENIDDDFPSSFDRSRLVGVEFEKVKDRHYKVYYKTYDEDDNLEYIKGDLFIEKNGSMTFEPSSFSNDRIENMYHDFPDHYEEEIMFEFTEQFDL